MEGKGLLDSTRVPLKTLARAATVQWRKPHQAAEG